MQIRLLCPHCKSEDIVRDACATWNGTEWAMAGVYDDMTCQNCGAEFYQAIAMEGDVK